MSARSVSIPYMQPRLRGLCAGLALAAALAALPAHAGDFSSDGNIVLAALDNTVPRHNGHDINIFGASEQRHTDIRPFTKWTGVIKRFKKEFAGSLRKKEVQDWMEFLGTLKDASPKEKVEAVNQYMNAVTFSADTKTYGQRDYWATPMEFLARGKGDCEDYAVAKYISLRSVGFSQDQMRMVIVFDHVMNMPHALLVVENEGETLVLDNQNPDVLQASDVNRYKPIYSISQTAWWRH
jgi:predicted transglutaminase-like cysteine proteinase